MGRQDLETAKTKLHYLCIPIIEQFNRGKANLEFRPYVNCEIFFPDGESIVAENTLSVSKAFGLFKKVIYEVRVTLRFDPQSLHFDEPIRFLGADIVANQRKKAFNLSHGEKLGSQGVLHPAHFNFPDKILYALKKRISDEFNIPAASIRVSTGASY